MRILITGGTGLIGTALATELVRHGHEVIALSRNPERHRRDEVPGADLVAYDGKTAEGWGHLVNADTAIINLAGIRQMAWFQNLTVVLKFVPLLLVAVLGWFFVTSANFGPFNASGGSLYDGIGIAAGVALFSFIGVECASIAAGRVKDPRRNVGRASVIGTAASGLLYVLVTAVIMGLVPHDKLVEDGAPFVAGIQSRLHHKDFAILMDEARQRGAPLPLAAQTWQQLNALMALGGGRLDTASLLKVLEAPVEKMQ